MKDNRIEGFYEEKIVLGIDILGFSSAIDNRADKQINEAVNFLHHGIASNFPNNGNSTLNPIKQDMKCKIDSDACIISIPLECGYNVFDFASKIYVGLLKRGFLSRGFITIGGIRHKNNQCYGPAYLEIARLEKERKISEPLIICTPSFCEVAANWKYKEPKLSYILDEKNLGCKVVAPLADYYQFECSVPERIIPVSFIEDMLNTKAIINQNVCTYVLEEKPRQKWVYMDHFINNQLDLLGIPNFDNYIDSLKPRLSALKLPSKEFPYISKLLI